MGKHNFCLSLQGKVLEGVLNTSNPAPVCHNNTLEMHPKIGFPSLCLILPEPILLPGIISETNFLHPRLCSRLVGGSHTKLGLRQYPNIVLKELVDPDGEVNENRGKHNTTHETHPGIGLKEMKRERQDPSCGIMEGFLEEVLSMVRPGNQEDTGLVMSICGCKVRQRG